MKFDHPLPAIKAVRQAGYDTKPTVILNQATGIYEIKFTGGPSLKQAKDIVEACMALGVRRYLEAELRYSRKIYQDDDTKPVQVVSDDAEPFMPDGRNQPAATPRADFS